VLSGVCGPRLVQATVSPPPRPPPQTLPHTLTHAPPRLCPATPAQASDGALRRQQEQQLQQLELDLQRAGPGGRPPLLKQQQQLRKLQVRRRRQRMNACLVARHAASGEVVGYASVCTTQPEALLPPPFPCSKPYW
jgi:hypothetical protein